MVVHIFLKYLKNRQNNDRARYNVVIKSEDSIRHDNYMLLLKIYLSIILL